MHKRPMPLIGWLGGKSAATEAAALSLLTLVGFSISAEFDLLEHFIIWSRQHEEYEVDEILMLTFIACISTVLFAVRRVIELRKEIARRQASDAEAQYLAFHDPLTGLANRAQFNDRLRFALQRVHGDTIAVLMVDLDRFKEVNDTLGHAAGDVLLRIGAQRLQGTLRRSDMVARLGGDEFAIIQTGCGQPHAARTLARRLVEELGEPYDLDGHEMRCGVSVGISLAPEDAARPDDLLRAADAALYQAKREGRSTFRFFEPGMNEALRARRLLEQDMRRALDERQFALHYQPLYELQGGALVGFEALLRWCHLERGEIPPADFIPLAEEIGLILPLGEWVLHTACREAAGWREPHKVAVNVSAIQFLQSDVVAEVEAALAASGLPAHRLELEITESLLIQNAERVLVSLERLHELGVSIAMDDFGTGYSSLSYLWRFPFDKLKIDGSFARNLLREPKIAEIVRTIVSLGRTLDLTVTAEGIETAEQALALTRHGCNLGQGFFLGRPMPAAAVAELAPAKPVPAVAPAE